MKKIILILTLFAASAAAQTIRVNPTGVNVNSQNPTTVFLTFGQIPAGYVPAEAVWCGELVPATPPALGLQCRPDTIYGQLPARYNLSQTSGNQGLTDIMSIPPSVVRRAYQAAVRGASAGFFYVRRFVSTTGQPDQFVNVTCRMTGGGARVPFALTDVQFVAASKEPILFLKRGEKFPAISAEIRYNGTGRLKGRWELVLPGEEAPADEDLLTEATLPIEDRAKQRRYTQIERFNHFLPPDGKFTLKLENPERLPINADGQYLLLLRIEATDDKEGDSNLSALGVGAGVVNSGAVAGFPLPTLKFFVSSGGADGWQTNAFLLPQKDAALNNGAAFVFRWREFPRAEGYRLEFLSEAGEVIFSALFPASKNFYQTPSWFYEKFKPVNLSYRLAALDRKGKVLAQTDVYGFALP
jgi:hypothetical protein